MSEDVFDITGFLEIVKRQKELRDESPKISKAEIWMALAADFNRKISLEDVDEADEYLITHELMETFSPLHTEDAPKTETAQSASPAPQSTRIEENPYSSGGGSGKAAEESRKQPEAPPLPTETQPSNLTIPKGVEPIPVKEIDDLIEQHYTREGIAKTMQSRHHKSFYSTITQRMRLYNQRVYGTPPPLPTEKTGKSPTTVGELPGSSPATSPNGGEITEIKPETEPSGGTVNDTSGAPRLQSDSTTKSPVSSGGGAHDSPTIVGEQPVELDLAHINNLCLNMGIVRYGIVHGNVPQAPGRLRRSINRTLDAIFN